MKPKKKKGKQYQLSETDKSKQYRLGLRLLSHWSFGFYIEKNQYGSSAHPKEPDLIPQSHWTIIHMIIVISLLLGCII